MEKFLFFKYIYQALHSDEQNIYFTNKNIQIVNSNKNFLYLIYLLEFRFYIVMASI